MKLSLAISPCPNDTFMFDAMLNGRIDTEGLEFEVVFKDIEELNAGLSAAEGVRPHISKASYAVLPQVAGRYCALRSGSALGRGNGPLLVAGDESARDGRLFDAYRRTGDAHYCEPAHGASLSAPFRQTGLSLLRYSAHRRAGRVRCGGADTRGTFRLSPLRALSAGRPRCGVGAGDRLPLPLGVIVADRNLPAEVAGTAERVLRRSIAYAFAHPADSLPFVREHAQELDEGVIRNHIEFFVNDYSLDIGPEGAEAVARLLDMPSATLFRA